MLKSKKTILGILLCAVMMLCALIGFMSVNPFKVEAKAWKGEAFIQFDSTLGHIEVDGDSKTISPVTISMELNPTMKFDYDVYVSLDENKILLTDMEITFTIEAIPNEGCVFAGWKVNDETLTNIGELDSGTTITAVFEEAGPATFETEFYFWDQNGDDVEGATLAFVDASGAILVSGTTDSDGLVTINVPLHQVGHFEVSKDGYVTIEDLFEKGDLAFSNPEEIYSYNTSSVLTKIPADAVETILDTYTYVFYPSIEQMDDLENEIRIEISSSYDGAQIILLDAEGNEDCIYIEDSWISDVSEEQGTYEEFEYNYTFEINVPEGVWGENGIVKSVEATLYVYVYADYPLVGVEIDTCDGDYGDVDNYGLTIAYGTPYSVDGNVLTIGDIDVTATANEGYVFSHWEFDDEKVTSGIVEGDMSFYAIFVKFSSPISYVDENGATQTLTDYVELNEDSHYDIFEEELPAGWYVVTENITYCGALITKNDLHLVICDGAMLEISYNSIKNEGKTLYVYGQANQTGALIVRGSGMDGDDADSSPATDGEDGNIAIFGNLCVNGCTVYVQGGNGGNGGWGYAPYGDGANGGNGGMAVQGSVTLNGGELTLIGGEGGYGGVEDGGKHGEKGKNGNAINTVPTVANGYKIFVGKDELSIIEYPKISEISDFHCVKVLKPQTLVEYINEVGNVSATTLYKNVTEDTYALNGGTYVVSGTIVIDGNVSVENMSSLILCDGASLTINGKISNNVHSLYIYAQKNQTGSLTVNANTEIAVWPHLTVCGGNVTINNEMSDAIGQIVGIENKLVVYNGVVTINVHNSGTTSQDYSIAVNGDVAVLGGSVTLNATDVRATSYSSAVGDEVTVTGGQLVMKSSGKIMWLEPVADGCEITASENYDGSNTVTYNSENIRTYKYLKIVAPVGSITIADILPSYFPTSFETGWIDQTTNASINLGEGIYKIFVSNGYLILSKNGSENIYSIAIDTDIEKVGEDFYTAKDSNENFYQFELTNGIVSEISIKDSDSYNYGTYHISLSEVLAKSEKTFPTSGEDGWIGNNGFKLYVDSGCKNLMIQAPGGKPKALKAVSGEARISVGGIIQTSDGNYLSVDKDSGGNILFNIENNYLTSIVLSKYSKQIDGTYTAPAPAITVESIFNTVDNVWSWTSDKGESLGDVLSPMIYSELVTTSDNLTYTLSSYNGMNISLVTDGETLQSITIANASFAKYDGTYTAPVPAVIVADILNTVENGFPSGSDGNAPSNAWVNSNNEKMFSCDGDLYVGGESDGDFVLSANTELTKDGNNYKCTKDGATVTFIMDDGALTSISIEGFTDDAKLNGTYEAPATQDLSELEARVKALEDLLGVDGSALKDLINQVIAKEVAEGGSIDQAIKLITDGLDSVISKLVDDLATLDGKVEGYKGQLDQAVSQLGDKDSKLEFLIKQSSEKMDMSLDQAKKELKKLIEDTAKELKDDDAMNLAEITEKIKELSAQVDAKDKDLQAQIDTNKSAIEKLISDLNALDGKVEGYKGQLDQLGDKDSKLEFLIKQSSEKMDMSLDQAKKELNKLIEDTAKELKDADVMNLAEITGKIKELSVQVDAKDKDLQAQIEANKSAIEKLISDLNALDGKVEGYKGELDQAVSQLGDKDSKLEFLIKQSSEKMDMSLDQAKKELKKLIEDTAKELKDADAKNLGDLTAKIEELSAQVEAKNSELAGKIAANTQAIEDLKTRVDGIDGEIATLKEQTGKLGEEDTRLAELIKSNDDAIKAALEQAKTDINGLIASKVEELQGADTKDLADLTAKIEELSAQVEAKNAELAGKIADNKAAIEKVAKDLADLDAKLAESKAELESKDKQIEDNISTFVTVVIIVGAVFLIGIAGLYVLVLKKKREGK